MDLSLTINPMLTAVAAYNAAPKESSIKGEQQQERAALREDVTEGKQCKGRAAPKENGTKRERERQREGEREREQC